MAKVYVSSTLADLKDEREAVMKWLVDAGHQPVHSYRPDSEKVRESCLNDIDGCGLYVLILGHRYGFKPEEGNPDNLSITHLEFRRAGQSKIPRVALLRTSIPDINLSDLRDPQRAPLVFSFIDEVRREVRPAEFNDAKGLISALSTGVQSELEKLRPQLKSDDPRILNILTSLTEENISLRGQVKELQEQLQAAIARTLTAAAQPDASRAATTAADALKVGDTRPAEALLQHQEREEAAQIGSPGVDEARQRREAAALAREQGALAMGHDLRAALAAFHRAAEYDPDDTWTYFFIGDLHVRLGDLNRAMQSFKTGRTRVETRLGVLGEDSDVQRDLAISHERIGDVLVAQGDGAGALEAYRKALAIVELLAACDQANTLWQRDLAVNYNKIGDVLVAQGDGAGALEAYRKALAIVEVLSACDQANTLWQRDLAVSQNRIGDVLVAQGDGAGALEAYRKALAIVEVLAVRDEANTLWQRDVAVNHNKIGDVLVAQGDGAGALEAYRKALAIVEALAVRDGANAEWQRDLSISHNKIGDVLVARGDGAGALEAYRKALAIVEALAVRDQANTLWQRDLSISHNRIGDVLVARGDGAGALEAYRKALAIVEALSARDQANTSWQRDLAISHNRMGDVLVARGDGAGALEAYRKALAIVEVLAACDPANAQWQTDLAVSCAKLGTTVHGQIVDARRDYLIRGRAILLKLKSQGRLLPNMDFVEWFDAELAKLPPQRKRGQRVARVTSES
jgi:tetratricopeptide (TPR) repeat protein